MFEIPLTETTLDEEEVEAATRVLRSKWLTMGAEVAAFESEFAFALGARHAIAVSNGTVALEICYRVAGIQPGDEVLLPAITFVACYNAARLLGAKPVLVDVTSEQDWTISPDDLKKKITDRSRLIVPMAHGGFCPAMNQLVAIAKASKARIVEDACHGPLAEVNGKKIGTFGLASTWSFFGNKNMTTGEGGMITTDDDAFAAECRLLRSHGITKTTWDRAQGHSFSYDVARVGTNARMDEIRAAIGRVQLRKLAAATEARARNAALLRKAIESEQIEGLIIPFTNHPGNSAHHLFCVLLPKASDRNAVMTSLKNEGIQTSIHYPPLNAFSATREYFAQNGGPDSLPVTDAIAPRILTLPLSPSMTDGQIGRVAEGLRRALASR
ncbi:DegT/DnrJ/EryC1/StrS aminotransferase family protein [soil metagenome]